MELTINDKWKRYRLEAVVLRRQQEEAMSAQARAQIRAQLERADQADAASRASYLEALRELVEGEDGAAELTDEQLLAAPVRFREGVIEVTEAPPAAAAEPAEAPEPAEVEVEIAA